MKLSSDKEIRAIIGIAVAQGWKVKKAKSNHIILYPPNSEFDPINMSSTPSCDKGYRNSISRLKKAGLII